MFCAIALWDNQNLFKIQNEPDVHFMVREISVFFKKHQEKSGAADLSDTGDILK